jgi:HK97 family phage major capsid protein
MSQQLKALKEKRLALGTQMRAIVDKADAEKRHLSLEDKTTFDKMKSEIEEIDGSVERISQLGDLEARLSAIPKDNIREIGNMLEDEGLITDPKKLKNTPAVKAFRQALRYGRESLEADQRKLLRNASSIQMAQSVGTGSAGGDIVPTGFMYELAEAEKAWGAFLGELDTIRTSTGQPLPWPSENDTGNSAVIIGENTQITEQDVAFNTAVTLSAYLLSTKNILVPETLIQDSAFDIDGLLTRIFAKRFGRGKNAYFTTGNGTNQPLGIVPAAVAAGNIVTAGGSANSGQTTSLKLADFLNLLHAVDPAYRDLPSSKFMMADTTLKVARGINDTTGRPIWMPGYFAGFGSAMPDTIFGKPYVINQAMAAPAASASTILFGDLKSYKQRLVVPEGSQDGVFIKRLVERYADYLQIGFNGFQRVDGNLLDAGTHPIAVLQQSAT